MSSGAHATVQAECTAVSGNSSELEQADSQTSAGIVNIDATRNLLGSSDKLTFVTPLPVNADGQEPTRRSKLYTETGAPPDRLGAPSQAIMDLDIALLKRCLSALQIAWSASIWITAAAGAGFFWRRG